MKRADEVFSRGQVHRGFSTNGGVHLAHQCRRHLDKSQAAQVHRGDEAGEVGDRATPHSHDDVRTRHVECRQFLTHRFEDLEALGVFAFRHFDDVHVPLRQEVEPWFIQQHRRRHDDAQLVVGAPLFKNRMKLVSHARTDAYVIGPAREGDLNLHSFSPFTSLSI